jgi:hypothetical protein
MDVPSNVGTSRMVYSSLPGSPAQQAVEFGTYLHNLEAFLIPGFETWAQQSLILMLAEHACKGAISYFITDSQSSVP